MALFQILKRAATATAFALLAAGAAAQTYPTRMMTLVVPYPAGGPSDFNARLIQPELTRLLGQQMIVENVGGVAGALGIQKMLSAPADGHTVTLASPMELVMAPLALSAVKFKPEDVKLAGVLVQTYMVLLGRKDLPANTVEELVALARKPSEKELSYGSVGPGSLYHLVAETFSQQTGAKMLHIPYKGAAPLVTDLLGGQIDLVFMPYAGNVPAMIKEGKVKVFGLAAKAPHPQGPEVPLLTKHKGLENFEFGLWNALTVPKSVPDAVVDRLHKAVGEALRNGDIRKGYESTGNIVVQQTSPRELARFYAAEIARYQAIAKSINLQAQ